MIFEEKIDITEMISQVVYAIGGKELRKVATFISLMIII